jgi:hypothetical protein
MKNKISLLELIDLVDNVGEINIVIKLLESGPLEKWVLKACILNKAGITANIPSPDILIDLTINLGLVLLKKNKITNLFYLTDLGKELLMFEPAWADRLSKQQGQYILSNVINKTELSAEFISVINSLDLDATKDFWISSQDVRIETSETRVLRLLQQLKIAQYQNDGIYITKENIEWLLDSLIAEASISETTLLKILDQKRQQGELAEEFVVLYEKERLCNCNMEKLSNMVSRISKRNISAGYDIASFDGVHYSKEHDRFIEVKSTVCKDMTFYITKNELETAKKFQNKYWLYCVLNVKSNNKKELRIMRNPFRFLIEQNKAELEPLLWRVQISAKAEKQFQQEHTKVYGK